MCLKRTLLAVLLSATALVSAQQKKGIEYSGFFDTYYWRGPVELTGSIGSGLYFGDLCGDLSCNKLKPDFALGASYKLWPRVSFGGEIGLLLMGADDAVTSRGYTYTGTNIELNGYGRYYFWDDVVRKQHDIHKPKKKFKPYFFTGVTGLFFLPKVTDASGTDVTDKASLPLTFVLPLGLGADFQISKNLKIGPEFAYKMAFSDKIDGVVAGSGNDPYSVVSLLVTYNPFHKKKKKHELTEEERAIIQKKVDEAFSGGDGSTTSDTTSTGDETVEEEYPEDNDLLQIEEEEELPDIGFDSEDETDEETTEEEEDEEATDEEATEEEEWSDW